MRASKKFIAAIYFGVVTLVSVGSADAAEPVAEQSNFTREFIRFVKTSDDEGHVDTAVKSYFRKSDEVVVTLASVIHIGDGAYYDKFQKLFESYDAVLYEMIRDEGDVPTGDFESDHPVSQMQMGMKNLLDLEFQLERIDYTRENFVHADLSPETFASLQSERGETLFGVLLRAALEEQRRQGENPETALNPFELLFAFGSNDRAHKLKLLLGKQMSNVEAMLGSVDKSGDGTQGSAILSGRNEHVMKVLNEQIEERKKRLIIFYGAGHMPDLEKRLLKEDFELVTEHWNVAWDITKKKSAKPVNSDR